MFDKMHLRTEEPIDEENLLKLGFLKLHGDSSYKHRFILQLTHGKRIEIKTRSIYPSAKDSVELNPARFKGWSELSPLLASIAPQDSFLIDRLDHTVDMAIPFLKLRETVRIQRKQTRDKYREVDSEKASRDTGIKSGEKPEIFCIYDKGYEYSKRFKLKSIPGTDKGVSTRIEVRHFSEKVKFPHLKDINKYVEYNPFDKIQSYELNEDYLNKDKVSRLKRDIELVGFHKIFRDLNQDGNFHKTWGRYFTQKPISEELRAIYQITCDRFLNE